MHVESHLSLAELKRAERGERDARRARRLRIVILAIEGFTAPAVAMSVGLSRRVCQSWVQRYHQFGLEGLEDQRGREPGGPLTAEQQQQIGTRLEDGPQPEDHVCSLRGRDVKRILDEEFGVLRSLSAVYKLLHRLGFRVFVRVRGIARPIRSCRRNSVVNFPVVWSSFPVLIPTSGCG